MKAQNANWLAELVVTKNLIKPEDFEAATHFAKKDNVHLLDVLVQHKFIDEQSLYNEFARTFGLKIAVPAPSIIEKSLVEKLGEKLCRSHMLIPINQSNDEVRVLISMPTDMEMQRDLSIRFGKKVNLYLGLRSTIISLLDHFFKPTETKLESSEVFGTDVPLEIYSLSTSGIGSDPEISKLPIIRVTKHILAAAIRQHAEMIHIEPAAKTTRIYFEIDGVKKTVVEYPTRTGSLIIQRSKYLGGLSLEKHSGPQNGRARIKTMFSSVSQNYEMRVSALPSSFGEKIIIKLLDKKNIVFPIDKLGMLPQIKVYLEKLMVQPSGLVLFACPPASGKTTTLYSAMQHQVDRGLNVYSIENSIHFTMEGVTQLEVNEKTGLTSAVLIRSALKEKPDVLVIDDIHDSVTAELVIQAAQGKTLVLATMNAESALAAVIHLINLGAAREAIAKALRAIITQQLAARICPHCKTAIDPPHIDFDVVGLMTKRGLKARFFKGAGCPYCQNTGYLGQTGIFEIFPVTREFADAIAKGTTEADLKLTARQIGIRSLVDYSLAHVVIGDTTLEEVMKFIDFRRHVVSEKPIEHVIRPVQSVANPTSAPDDTNGRSRVLVAEDNDSVRSVIRSVLQTNGFEVIEARNGRETLEKMRGALPDIVLVDISMPYLSGLDILRKIRGHAALQHMPVIVLTANNQAQTEFDALEIGADDFIVKPFRPELLTARIRAVLRRSYWQRPDEQIMIAA